MKIMHNMTRIHSHMALDDIIYMVFLSHMASGNTYTIT